MAAEEDKKFDAVLGGFLVHDLRIRAGDLHCPESDTLAAYHERSLVPEEMNSWKEHIVGCARCQAILAELEATDAVPLEVSENEEVLTATPVLAAATAKEIPPRREATVTLPGKSRVIAISRGVRWPWLAPAGALAAGLLVWIAWHEHGPLQVTTPEIKTARVNQPAASPVSRNEGQVLSAEEVSPVPKDQGGGGGAPRKPAPTAKNLKQFAKSDLRNRVAREEPPADKEARARTDAALDSLAAANRAQNQPAPDAKAGAVGAVGPTVEAHTFAASAPAQSQPAQQNLPAPQNQLNGQKVSGPNSSRVAETVKKRKSESPARHPAAVAPAAQPGPSAPAPVAAFNDGAALRMAAAISPSVIAAPDGKTLWRAGHAGMIEFSTDGGASWLRQASNVFADLTAGSAPSDKVCWIVGRAGTILLTTDSGSHWATLHSPLDEDLGGLRARDALHATIWNLANTKVLETSDGGATWKPGSPQ